MGVKCLAQEHNTVPRPGLELGPFDPESSALTIRPPRLYGTRELKDTRKLKSQNLVLISAVVSSETKLPPEDPFSDVEI